MKISIVVLFALFLGVVFADDVLVLTQSNFDSTVNNADIILVEFYAPWCGHCKKLEPEFSKAASRLKNNDPPVLLAKVDATVESALGSRFDVKGYPTLKIFRKGEVSAYGGPRDENGIVAYMEKQAGPSSVVLNSVDAVEKFLAKDEVGIIGFFSEKGADYKAFSSASSTLREEFRFGEVTDQSVISHFGENGVVLFREKKFSTKNDDGKARFTGSFNTPALTQFFYDNVLPLVGEYNQASIPRYTKKGLPVFILFTDVNWGSNSKQTTYWMNRLRKISEGVEGKMLFAVADKKARAADITRFGLSGSGNLFGIENLSKKLVYPGQGEFSVESGKAFLDSFLEGKVEAYIKSEPVPENNNGPVKTVVAKNFQEIVMDSAKDVLIEFYAPWCGHCKSLAPKYEELGKKFQDAGVNDIVIAKMDATANDVPPEFNVRGYPTIYFVPKSNKPVTYDGQREVKDFVSWLKNKATTPFNLDTKSEL